ncbi:MAG: SH3 domain-containing protein [Chloroflexota bacterium]
MRIWITFILLTLFTLTACASPGSASPTPTIVRLDRSALTPTPAAEMPATDVTSISFTASAPTSTSTTVATTAPVAATLPLESAATPATPAAPQAEIVAAGLNVREGPGLDYAVTGAATQGDILAITGASANGAWLQIVTTQGQAGWISGQSTYSRVLGSLSNVPVLNVEPLGLSPGTKPANLQPANLQPATEKVTSGGQIVFTTRSGGDLYVVNADGTDLRKLAGGVIDPVVSPDGTQVAFTRWDGAKMGALYVLNLDDGRERLIAGDIARAKSPAWSPDGQAIIISFQHGGTVNPPVECQEFDFDDRVRIPDDVAEITSFKVTAENISVCFIRREDLQWGLRQIDLASGAAEDLPADLYSFSPTWDPQNSARVIYDGLRGLMQLDIAAGDLQPFTDDVRDTAPVFSPDGQKLALTYKQHDHWEVYTYDLATGSRQRLTKPPILADPQYSSAAPAWSPDGSRIAFVTNRSGRWEIWVMNADGSHQQPLFSTEVQAQLGLDYQGVNERLLNWIR